MIGAEVITGTLRLCAIEAEVLAVSGEDEENIVDARLPAVHLLSMGHFLLNIAIEQRILGIPASISSLWLIYLRQRASGL